MHMHITIHPKLKSRRAAVCGLLAAAAVAVPTALAIGSSSEPDLKTRLAAGPAAPTQSVSPSLAKWVPALNGPVDTDPPSAVRGMVSIPSMAALGVNPALTRAVPAPAGSAGDEWYLTPGDDALCISTDKRGAACAPTDMVAHQGLPMITLPLPAGIKLPDGRPVKPTPAPQVVEGIAPAGTTTVQAIDADGTIEATAEVAANGTYRVVSNHATKVVINGGDGPVTIPLG